MTEVSCYLLFFTGVRDAAVCLLRGQQGLSVGLGVWDPLGELSLHEQYLNVICRRDK